MMERVPKNDDMMEVYVGGDKNLIVMNESKNVQQQVCEVEVDIPDTVECTDAPVGADEHDDNDNVVVPVGFEHPMQVGNEKLLGSETEVDPDNSLLRK